MTNRLPVEELLQVIRFTQAERRTPTRPRRDIEADLAITRPAPVLPARPEVGRPAHDRAWPAAPSA